MASPENLLEAAGAALWGKRGKRAGAAFFQVWQKEVVRLAREGADKRADKGTDQLSTAHCRSSLLPQRS